MEASSEPEPSLSDSLESELLDSAVLIMTPAEWEALQRYPGIARDTFETYSEGLSATPELLAVIARRLEIAARNLGDDPESIKRSVEFHLGELTQASAEKSSNVVPDVTAYWRTIDEVYEEMPMSQRMKLPKKIQWTAELQDAIDEVTEELVAETVAGEGDVPYRAAKIMVNDAPRYQEHRRKILERYVAISDRLTNGSDFADTFGVEEFPPVQAMSLHGEQLRIFLRLTVAAAAEMYDEEMNRPKRRKAEPAGEAAELAEST